ncbi:MAG: transporter [Rhodocyclales bacterium]|nr:transporter [Rhodocyclales bacterium]
MTHQTRTLFAVALAALAPSAWAAGFALQNQNGSGNGNAFAGAAAAAEDAGTIFFNPAGMTLLQEGHSIALGGTVLDRSIEFTNKGTVAVPTGFPLGTNGGDAGGTSVIPFGYWSMSLSPALRVGLGISPTFGNKTEYDTTFIGRFSGYYAELQQININPAVAYKLNDAVSLGFGINYALNEIEFRQMVPIGAATQTPAILKGDDDGWGWNVGAMFRIGPATRLGIAYRSTIEFDLEGTQTVVGVPANSFAIKSKLETPDSFSMALSQKLDDRWELLGDLTWTGWSSIKTLPVIRSSTGTQVTSLSYNFEDTWRVGIGANYLLNDAWKLRIGTAYDKSPVKNDADRTMTLPDADRTWLAFGARYTLSKETSVDLGYSHIFFKKVSTERAVPMTTPPFGTQTVRGEFETSADLLSVQLNHRF